MKANVNPRKQLTADLIVIGAGSGGLSVAAGAAQLGQKVILFEAHEMGGDCLNTGCVPSKALIAAGKAAQNFRDAGRFGLTPAEPFADWAKVKAHVEGVIAQIAPVDSQERFEGLGVTVVREFARFKDRNTIQSDSVEAKARRIVIATGSRAAVPPIPGLGEVPYLTNETVFKLDRLPEHLVILGAGPIGVELGQAFRRLGAKVTLIEAQRALARADAEHAAIALARLRHEGVTILEGHKAVRVDPTVEGIAVSIETTNGERRAINGSHLLLALGRKPNTKGLDLDIGKVAHTPAGITTKDNLRSTSNPRVWAVGDVAGYGQFTHLAGWHASVFVRNALFKSSTPQQKLPLPAVTYCEPEVAQIGLTDAEAKVQFGEAMRVVGWSFHENDRALAERASEGGVKLICNPKGRLLGASIVGDGAGDLIQIVGVAMSNGLTVRALTNIIAPYPTRGEIIKRAAGAFYTPLLFSKNTQNLVRVLSRF
jgi:pyruvate/2-oxoglutarate dehydrogenase complex dihydrolipoamide dehydrogenase (E3) component